MRSRPQSGDGQPAVARTPVVLFSLLSILAVVVFALIVTPIRVGDADEYLLMVQALSSHGSPDIRTADIESHIRVLNRNGLLPDGQVPKEYYLRDSFTTADGTVYFGHFWFFSLLAVPAWVLLRFAGGNEMAALQSMNAVFFCIAAGFVLFHGRDERRDRLLLLALSALGPIIWYIRWPHPEVYTWAAAMIAVALLRRNRFGWAAVSASLGALQNPPLVLLALLAVVLAAGRRDWRAAVRAAAGTALSFLPSLFTLVIFGVPNLFVAKGVTDFALISPGRVWSVLADLNQGMLPHVPLVLLLGLLGGGVALIKGRTRGILVLVVFLGMILMVGPQRNWNAGAAGMMRYAVWMVPLLAWLAVDFVPRRRCLAWGIGAGLLLQAGMVMNHDGRDDSLRQNDLARVVLARCPLLYSPDPQIFAERQLGRNVEYWSGRLPVPFVTKSGHLTKLLLDAGTHRHLQEYFLDSLNGDLLVEQEEDLPDGLYYLHPPRRALRVVDQEGMDPRVFSQQLRIELREVPANLFKPEFEITVEVTNQGPFGYWGKRSCTPSPVNLGYRAVREETVVTEGRADMPFFLKPGGVKVRAVRIKLPHAPGRYDLTISTLVEDLAWSESAVHLTVDCSLAEPGQYRATVAEITEPEG